MQQSLREPESIADLASAFAIGADMRAQAVETIRAAERAYSAGNSAISASRLKPLK